MNEMYALDNAMDEIAFAMSRLMTAYANIHGGKQDYSIGKVIGQAISITQMASPYNNADDMDSFIETVTHHATLEYNARQEMAMASRNYYK